MTYVEFKAIIEFLGDDMTEEQSVALMDRAKDELSRADIQRLYENVSGPLYTDLSMYNGEMGGLNHY